MRNPDLFKGVRVSGGTRKYNIKMIQVVMALP